MKQLLMNGKHVCEITFQIVGDIFNSLLRN